MRIPLQGAALVAGLMLGSAAGYLPDAVLASRNSGGTYSLPLSPVVTGNTITSTWANTTLSDISTELTNSLDRGGRGAMTAPLQLANGTVSLPALTFASDTDSGLYRIGANNPGIAVNGVKAQEWGTATVTVPLGLTVTQDTTDGIAVTATGNGTGAGGTFASGTDATGGTRQDALKVTNGDIDLSGVANPTSTTSISERLTPMNLPKAWGRVTTTGMATTATVNSGFNVTSAEVAGTTMTVTIAADLAAGAGAVVVTPDHYAGTMTACSGTVASAGTVTIRCYSATAAGLYNFETDLSRSLSFVLFGAQ